MPRAEESRRGLDSIPARASFSPREKAAVEGKSVKHGLRVAPSRWVASRCEATARLPANSWSYENSCGSDVNQRVVRRDWTPPIQINLVLARSLRSRVVGGICWQYRAIGFDIE